MRRGNVLQESFESLATVAPRLQVGLSVATILNAMSSGSSSVISPDASRDYSRIVAALAVPHRYKSALRTLMAAGGDATPALREGLSHPDAEVRLGCCIVLDHFLDEAALPNLVANLSHEDARVRARALHALACDRCKEGACRPGEEETVPLALRMLAEDSSSEVRLQAVGLLFTAAHRRPEVAAALEHARERDSSPAVRKAARLRAPGGVMYLRTSPEHPRLRNSGPRAHLKRY